ncbi:DUF1254 domain-containing protein [Poseidonocella sp. HB161398]|uniref:DUF1254 domain-containing protein n=1 Tax=Poseidonocella sp. HB161398 TaxID=2320855 RepID=UPI00197FFE29|nr:DUF1254 domain-containing protein [Poseidonocella sp. HB161398]
MRKHIAATASCLALLAGAPAIAQQSSGVPELSMPDPEAMPQEEYVRMLARQAFVWGWPMVNMQNRHDQITQAPEPGLLGGILPVAPQGRIAMLSDYILPSETFVACPNQDVVYGLGFFDLNAQPVIVQVPDFGDRFWVYALYDARTDQFGELGKPYGTAPGFYLLAGPDWDGDVPAGVTDVLRSSTALANAIPRIFKDDTPEDAEAVQALIDQVVVYPLDSFDGTMKTIDWSEAPDIPNPAADAGGGETQWVVPEKYFDQFGKVLATVPPLPGEEAMYAQFKWLLDVAAKSGDLKQAIADEAVQADREVIQPFFRWEHNGRPAGNGWNRSVNNADWGLDYFDRTGTAKSNMFDNRPSETQYFYTDYDAGGNQLEGAQSYTVTFAAGQEPPVDGFWSLTLYNDRHLFAPNDLDRYSLGTKSTGMQRNEDGSLTIHVGHESPGAALESNWLPAPEGEFSLYIRAYWGQAPITGGTWQPPVIEVAG